MIQARDPRVERWMQKLADEMEAIKEKEGAEEAARKRHEQERSRERQENHTGASGSDECPAQAGRR